MPLPEPFDLQVLKALTTALEEITVANGYRHDMAGSVFRGRMLFSEDDPIPMISINQPPQMPEDIEVPRGSSAAAYTMDLIIQGFVDDDFENPTDPAFYLLADVRHRLAVERKRDDGFDVLGFGAKVQMHVGQGVVRSPDADVSDRAFFWLPVTLEFAEEILA
jgi:hypothetical protein